MWKKHEKSIIIDNWTTIFCLTSTLVHTVLSKLINKFLHCFQNSENEMTDDRQPVYYLISLFWWQLKEHLFWKAWTQCSWTVNLPLLIPYSPWRVLRSSVSANLLQVPHTNLTFRSRSPCSCRNHPQLSPRINQSIHLIYFAHSGSTLNIIFSQQLSTPQPWQQTPAPAIHVIRVTNGALLMFHLLTYLMTMSKRP